MSSIWAIADLHLSFGTPNKEMQVFGKGWERHTEKLSENWQASVAPDDLVLIPGDISWAKLLQDARVDLEWIHALPGTKVLLRGNHDYWWSSLKAIKAVLPPSMILIQNNSFTWHGVAIGGSRMWDTPGMHFDDALFYQTAPTAPKTLHPEPVDDEESEKVFTRELQRLEMSLKTLDPTACFRIAMTHYPPINARLEPSPVSALLENYRIDLCVFGHLHSVLPRALPFGKVRGVQYLLTAFDYLDGQPIKVWDDLDGCILGEKS